MTAGQRFVRLVTDVVVRVPFAWRLFRGTMTRSFDKLAPTWEGRISDERLAPMKVALGALAEPPATRARPRHGHRRVARIVAEAWPRGEGRRRRRLAAG